MEVMFFPLALLCAVISLIVYYAWRILNWVWFRPRKLEKSLRQLGFDGNPYRLLYGDLKDMGLMVKEAKSKPINFSNDIVPRSLPIVHKAVTKYGEKCFIWFGARPAIIILDPEIIREIMTKHYIFQKPPNNAFARLVARGLVHETNKWAKHRKLINPAFHVEKLKFMVPSFYLSCADMLSEWEKIVPSKGSSEMDVWPYLQKMTSDVISRTAFGSSFQEGRRIFELQREQAEYVMEANRSVYIPELRFLPTKFNRKTNKIVKEVESSLLSIINRRLKAMEKGEASKDDLLGLLLESNMNEIKQYGNHYGMSLMEVIEECKLFYFAGQETTASLLVWTMVLLSKHKEWQDHARDEVFRVFGTTKPGYQELNHLKIVSMILYEVLRLYPPGLFLSRITKKESTLGKMTLPEGVQLMMPVISLHHDRKLWGEDAEEFKPERFNDGVLKATQGQLTYFPFGWGARICIGQSFAMLEAKMAMAMILQHYSFELSPSYSHAPHSMITLQPQHGAHLILTKLPSLPKLFPLELEDVYAKSTPGRYPKRRL